MRAEPTHLEHDWYAGGIPANVRLGADVYLDSAYGFEPMRSRRPSAVVLGDACGAYDRATLAVGPEGEVTVGEYTVLNGVYVVCRERIEVGAHALLAWGSVLTDCWRPESVSAAERRGALERAAADPERVLPAVGDPLPVVLQDNVWVGFDAVILPGVTLGRGCIVGSKTVISADVPPYAVVVGNPARLVRTLEADDTDEAREWALQECVR